MVLFISLMVASRKENRYFRECVRRDLGEDPDYFYTTYCQGSDDKLVEKLKELVEAREEAGE